MSKNRNQKTKIKNVKPSVPRFKFCASRGFTLIEMIVSLAIFSIVAVVALGALMKIVSANKKAQSLQSAMTNINYALESISREMRVGSDFTCVSPLGTIYNGYTADVTACSDGFTKSSPPSSGDGVIIAFKSSHVSGVAPNRCNLISAYSFDKSTTGTAWDIKKATQVNCAVDVMYNTNAYTSIIDPNVIITGFYVKLTSDTYPLATIRLSGYVGARELERTYFNVQTAVSARVPSGQ